MVKWRKNIFCGTFRVFYPLPSITPVQIRCVCVCVYEREREREGVCVFANGWTWHEIITYDGFTKV